MWELDCEESWMPKNWCFWTVVLEKTLESLLDCKEIQPIHPKGHQSWIFIEGLMLKLKLQYFGHLMWRTDSLERPWCWENLKAWEEGDNRTWELVMDTSLSQLWELVINKRLWKPGVCRPWGLKDSGMTVWLNWTELMAYLTWYLKLTNAMVAYFFPTMHNYKCAGVEETENFIQAKLECFTKWLRQRGPRE